MYSDHGSSRSGLGDWQWQRLSALVLAALLPALFGLFLCLYQGSLDQAQLAQLLQHPMSRTLATLMLLAMMIHTYTGVKMIAEDYLHLHTLRSLFIAIVIIGLSSLTIALTALIWGVADVLSIYRQG